MVCVCVCVRVSMCVGSTNKLACMVCVCEQIKFIHLGNSLIHMHCWARNTVGSGSEC